MYLSNVEIIYSQIILIFDICTYHVFSIDSYVTDELVTSLVADKPLDKLTITDFLRNKFILKKCVSM